MNREDDLLRETQALRERLSRLSEASLRINESLDFDTVLQDVLDSARSLTRARCGIVTLLDESGRIVDFLSSRLNAKSFEGLIVGNIRENILTESNIRDLVKIADEKMDGIAREQRKRLKVIQEELDEVKRRLGRIWQVIETTVIEMADASDRIREHRERKEKLEIAAEEARAILAERRVMLDSADTIATFAEEMSDFLKTSELTETRAFVHSFVKEVQVKPGRAAIIYSIPTPDDSPIGGADAAEIALNGRVMNSVLPGGPEGARTPNLGDANAALSQLSYSPRQNTWSADLTVATWSSN